MPSTRMGRRSLYRLRSARLDLLGIRRKCDYNLALYKFAGGLSSMPGIRVKENEPFEVAIRRFKRTIEKAGVLTELRSRESMNYCNEESGWQQLDDYRRLRVLLLELLRSISKSTHLKLLRVAAFDLWAPPLCETPAMRPAPMRKR